MMPLPPMKRTKLFAPLLLLPLFVTSLLSSGCGGGGGASDGNTSVTRDTAQPSLVNYAVFGSDSSVVEVKATGNEALPRGIPVVTPTTTLTVSVGIVDEGGLDMTRPPEVLLYAAGSMAVPSAPVLRLERYTPQGLGTPLHYGDDVPAPAENSYWRVQTTLPSGFTALGSVVTVVVRATDKSGNTTTAPVGTFIYSSNSELSANLRPYVPPFTSVPQ